ncbi:UpaP162 family type II restriction enzyme [Metamycoplasma hominis]|nr:hypothetical protein [Metamycoplasma hominis]BBD81559.1 hypothetical protein UPV_230 [Ureaplasma parvum serovar 3]
MMDNYVSILKDTKKKVVSYLKQVFKVYGDELLLRLEDYNLLSDANNCLESSTSIGFIMEEFITTKLKIYTKNHSNNEVKIEKINRSQTSTVNCSYDCYSTYNGIFHMINVKTQKANSNNYAVAAINILHKDYVQTNPNKVKSYLVLKVKYDFDFSKLDDQRKIVINDVDAYYLEEIDFRNGHKQDHRNWSTHFNANSGRLLVSESFKREHHLVDEKISYENTKQMLDDIYNGRH